MVFTTESQLVKDYVLLINAEKMSFDDVPQVFNLKDVVKDVLDN